MVARYFATQKTYTMSVRMLLPLLLVAVMAATACNSSKKMPSADIYQHWKHAHEQDETGARIFRPATFAFPPSRGREAFEIQKDGTFIRYAIGANDVPVKMMGKWKMKKRNLMQVTLDDPSVKPYTIEILELKNDLLKIKN